MISFYKFAIQREVRQPGYNPGDESYSLVLFKPDASALLAFA